jgi:hypothetical protein
MSTPTGQNELFDLLEALCNGAITPADHQRLEERLAADPAARQFYFDYLDLHLHLQQWRRARAMPAGVDSNQPSFVPPIILDQSPARHSPLFTLQSSVGGFLFSYTMAALILGLVLLVGWTWKIHYDRQIVRDAPRRVPTADVSESSLVGRITGTADCRWADSTANASQHDSVSLGREYALLAGFLEITYDSGAKVILQGPATYTIESAGGGFLSLGRLTARMEHKESGVRGQGLDSDVRSAVQPPNQPRLQRPKSELANPSPLAPLPSPLFSVRTPTAIVTDLGTEFGVEVDKSGASRAHVFRGEIEVRAVDGDSLPSPLGRGGGGEGRGRVIQLRENESARIERDANRRAAVIREPDRSNARTFTREMPSQVPIDSFNTGAGLKEGDMDPHWQIVAVSNDPDFKPRPAVVTAVPPEYLPRNTARSQWISIGNGPPALPNGVVCTFRTTCVVRSAVPPGRTPNLDIQLRANKRVKAIRVNGKNVRALDDAVSAGRDVFGWEEAMHEGVNCVEFDVTNEDPSHASGASPILLKVTWH